VSSRAEQKRELREQREAAERADADAATRRKRTAYLAGGISLIALIVVAALVLVSQSGGGNASVDSKSLFSGVDQQGITLGDPKAPVTVVEFADLQCPFCQKFALNDLPGIVDDFVKPGDVKMELRLLAFIGPDSETGRGVAAGAAQQNRIWPFAENVYTHQETENSGYMTTDFLRAQASGISGLDADKAVAAVGSTEAQTYASESDSAAQAAGVSSTPTFAVSSGTGKPEVVDAAGLRDAIDQALAQSKQQ
jgi:protein-disulfide isomerase